MDNLYKAFCSWSGGKDSCLSLYRAIEKGIKVEYLFTMFTEDGNRSRGHGLNLEIMKKYAKLFDMELIYGQATWDNYENIFKEKMYLLEDRGVNMGIFGDIDIDEHREWVRQACSHTGIEVYHPLWKESRRKIIEEFVDEGFQSIIVTLNSKLVPKEYLGRVFDKSLIEEFRDLGIDPCGENGEFHTAVIDGPIFKKPLKLNQNDIIKVQNYWMLDLVLG